MGMTDEPNLVWENRGNVKKANSVVMHRAKGQLQAIDHKLFNYLLNRAYYKIRHAEHRIPVRDAIDYLGPDANINTLNESLRRLGEVHIEIDYEEMTGEKRLVGMHFLSYDTCRAIGGILTYVFDPLLLPFLYEPKIYAQLKLQDLRNFKTLAGERLYEKMMLHHKRSYDHTWTVPIEELYEFCGLPKDSRLDNVKKRVIDPAVNEVNEFAPFNLKVSFDGGRGRKTNLAQFTIVAKNHQDMMSPLRVTSAKAHKLPQDTRSIDLFDGKTAEQRGSSIVIVISEQAYAEAEELIKGTELSVDAIERQWREYVSGRRLRDADQQFLNWVAVQVEKAKDSELAKVNDDIIGDLLG
jgi:hypothetical protein